MTDAQLTPQPDPAALAALHARCFTVPRPWSASEIAQMIATPSVFLAGDATGFVMGRVIVDEAELLTLAVLPEGRRKGRGRALLRQFVALATAHGATRGFLEVAADNFGAQALYAAAGWSPIGRRKGYYATPQGAPVDAIVLGCGLPEASGTN